MIIGQVKFITNGETRTFKRRDGSGEVLVVIGYLDLDGLYPEKAEFFIRDLSEVLGRGEWLVPITARMYNGKFMTDLDFKKAQPFIKPQSTNQAKAS